MRGFALPVWAAALALGGCSGVMDKLPDVKTPSFEWNPYSKASSSIPSTFNRVGATPADFVNADGSCAGSQTQTADGEPTPAVPTGGAIGLQMTECAVVLALGVPEKIDLGSNARGERTAKLLYSRGERPGLYSFTSGLLTEIERVAEPEPPPKPQKKPPPKPVARRAT